MAEDPSLVLHDLHTADDAEAPVSTVGQLRNKIISVNAPNDIGTLLIDSLLLEHGLKPDQVHYANNVPFLGVAAALTTSKSPISAQNPGWARTAGVSTSPTASTIRVIS